MKTHTFFKITCLTALLSFSEIVEADIAINLKDTRQEIDGFGACFVTYTGQPAYRDPMFYDLAVYDLGISMVRAHFFDIATVNENLELDPELLEKTEYGRMILREFKKRGIETFFTSNWSPPASFKTNKAILHGGYLNPDSREDFGRWMVANINALKEIDDIDITAISIQNELMFIEPYPSCLYSPIQFRETFRSINNTFQDNKLNTKILLPEDMGWFDRSRQYIDAIMKDPETSNFSGILCSHGWAGDENWERMGTLSKEHNRKFWMTETSGHHPNWNGALAVASDIHRVLVKGNASAYAYWQMNDRTPGGAALMQGGRHGPKSIAMKHFARYVRPGAHRIYSHTTENEIQSSAYFHPKDETLTIVLINSSEQNLSTHLETIGSKNEKARFNKYESTENQYFNHSVISAKDTITIPARGIVTLYGRLDGKLNQILPLAPSSVVLDNDAPLAPNKTTTQDEKLQYAARNNKPEEVQELLESGYNPNIPSIGGYSPLHRSAWPGHVDMIDLLIDGGADPNPVDAFGETPLHIAASNGHDTYVRHLVSRGADVDFSATLTGQTPLHAACRAGNLDTVKILIELGADVNAIDNSGWNSLFFAASTFQRTSNAILELLLSYGANPAQLNDIEQTALHVAASNLHSTSGQDPNNASTKLSILVAAGCDVNQLDSKQRTPLHYLARIGHWGYRTGPGNTPVINQYDESLKMLLDLGTSPDLRDQFNKSPIDYAREEGYFEYANLLKSTIEKETLKTSNRALDKSLLQAVSNDDLSSVATLLEKGANPTFKEAQGGTSLHFATSNGNIEMIQLLLENGADQTIRDSDGYLPSERAQQNDNTELFELLK